jgi:hypothetical protein
MKWTRHAALGGGGMINAYKIFVRKPDGKRPLGSTRHRWEDNIIFTLRKYIGCEGMHWIQLAQVKLQSIVLKW